jgi:hypothetical protein
MRAMFLFLRVVASLISLSFIALGASSAVLAVWLVGQLPRTGIEICALAGMAGFGAAMVYLGSRVLRELVRMAAGWWQMTRHAGALPRARLVRGSGARLLLR